MLKIYITAFILSLVCLKSFSQDTINSLPPSNLQAHLQGGNVQISWQAPVDSLTLSTPPGLIGYRIYSNSAVIGYTDSEFLSFFDVDPDLPVSFYKATALYDLTYYGFPGDTAESVPSKSVFAVCDIINQLSFEEDFTTGSFETNQWIAEGNWQIAGQAGNPAPSVEFNFEPVTNNYSASLTSYWMDGSGYVDGKLYVNFDLKFQTNSLNNTETLILEVFNGEDWITEEVLNHAVSINWSEMKVDISDVAFGIPFQIRFRAEGENSNNIQKWQLDNIRIYRECASPKELTYTNQGDYSLLEWEDPEFVSSGWLEYDNGINYDGLACAGVCFTVGVRFTPEQLSQYSGAYLSKIRLFPYGFNDPLEPDSLILKVWTGENASQLMTTQLIETYTPGEWNEFYLDNPVLISGTTELWFGYEIISGSGSYVVPGADAGPAVAGYGDMIGIGGLWESLLLDYGMDYNWNLGGFVTGNEIEETLLGHSSLSGYNIYKDNVLFASTTSTQYEALYTGPACYNVTAVYEDCESEFSNTACTSVSVRNLDLNTVNIYPNPASSAVTIEWEGEMKELILIDIMGRVTEIYSPTPGNSTMTINLTNILSGVYSIKLETTGGKIGYAKLIRL